MILWMEFLRLVLLHTTRRGFVCVFPQDQPRPIWIPARNVQHHPTKQENVPPLTVRSRTEEKEEEEEEAEEIPHPEGQQDLLEGHP